MDAKQMLGPLALLVLAAVAAMVGFFQLGRERRKNGALVAAAAKAAEAEAAARASEEAKSGQLQAWQKSYGQAKAEVAVAELRITALEKQVAPYEKLQRLQEKLRSHSINEPGVMAAFAAVNEDTPLWLALLKILEDQQQQEVGATLLPNLSDAATHYCRGRAAALADFSGILMQLRARAQSPEATQEASEAPPSRPAPVEPAFNPPPEPATYAPHAEALLGG
jgi:hypothetical protein